MKTPENKKSSVLIALIHNNNQERNSIIRQNLKKLNNILSDKFIVSKVEISYQPNVMPLNTLASLRLELIYLRLENNWSKYRLIKITTIKKYLRLLMSLIDLLKKYSLNLNNYRIKWQKSNAIEMCVTDKHIRAWDVFLESDYESLLMFEDDAIFKLDSYDKLLHSLSVSKKIAKDTLLFADLAGGLPLEDLGISHLVKERKDGITIYSKPVTNTACGYLLNRSIVEEFRRLILIYPNYRLLGIDWMINQLLIDIDLRKKKTFCFHFEPTALNHGSFTGKYLSMSR